MRSIATLLWALSTATFTIGAFVPSSNNKSDKITLSPTFAGKGFGEKSAKQKSKTTTLSPLQTEDNVSTDISPPQPLNDKISLTTEASGSKLLQELRSREAEKRDAELSKLRFLRETDTLLQEDSGAAAIPEKVAQRMGNRMLPFVGIPLFGSVASFVGFWYMATYQGIEFQPALVATTSFVFLAISLLGITYSIISASWDDDREGSSLGLEEFSKNVASLKDGLARTKENALLREKMAGLSEDELERALDDQERRYKAKNKKNMWVKKK